MLIPIQRKYPLSTRGHNCFVTGGQCKQKCRCCLSRKDKLCFCAIYPLVLFSTPTFSCAANMKDWCPQGGQYLIVYENQSLHVLIPSGRRGESWSCDLKRRLQFCENHTIWRHRWFKMRMPVTPGKRESSLGFAVLCLACNPASGAAWQRLHQAICESWYFCYYDCSSTLCVINLPNPSARRIHLVLFTNNYSCSQTWQLFIIFTSPLTFPTLSNSL